MRVNLELKNSSIIVMDREHHNVVRLVVHTDFNETDTIIDLTRQEALQLAKTLDNFAVNGQNRLHLL